MKNLRQQTTTVFWSFLICIWLCHKSSFIKGLKWSFNYFDVYHQHLYATLDNSKNKQQQTSLMTVHLIKTQEEKMKEHKEQNISEELMQDRFLHLLV